MKISEFLSALGISLLSLPALAQNTPASGPTSEPTSASTPEKSDPIVLAPEEEEGGLSYGAEVDFNSIYGWRGIALSGGGNAFGPVSQPSAWASIGGASFSAWSSFTINNNDGFGTFQELDLTGEYELEAAGFTIIPRAIIYLVPEASVGEVELELDHDLGPLSAYLINSVGFFGTPASYFGQVGLSYEKEFDFGLTAGLKAGVGVANGIFNDFNLGVDKTSLNFVLAGVEGSYYFLNDVLYARLHAEFSDLLDGDLAGGADVPLILNAGLAVGFEM